MRYVVYKRFRGAGIDGNFNLPAGTSVDEQEGWLYCNGRCVCAATSENGWGHFRPDTIMAAHRQTMLEALYRHYERTGTACELKAKPGENSYWKNILRTMDTPALEKLCEVKKCLR